MNHHEERRVVAKENAWRAQDAALFAGYGRMAAPDPVVAAALDTTYRAVQKVRQLQHAARSSRGEGELEAAGHEALVAVVTAARLAMQEAAAQRLRGWQSAAEPPAAGGDA